MDFLIVALLVLVPGTLLGIALSTVFQKVEDKQMEADGLTPQEMGEYLAV